MFYRLILSAAGALIFSFYGVAHEGMWIPSTLSKLIMPQMEDYGLELSAEEIYSINQSSLKDAIVHFGGGCTASVISDQGLILTNHHCGYSQIQYHSSVENDYLKDGFWAETKLDELPNTNLTATFVVEIRDVSEAVLNGIKGLEGEERSKKFKELSNSIIMEATGDTHYDAQIKSFSYGNAYYMIITETYNDVRLVGAPPSSIGKFGGDTDNWVWPRHTGDFSLFRIYADSDNMPAEYSETNVPFKPKRSLDVNISGLDTGDFTMVFGFPGRTEQYLPSAAVKYILDIENPAKIEMREASLAVIDRARESSAELRIAYAAKQSRISNAYKKWIGQSLGLKRFNAVQIKKDEEEAFMAKASRSGKPELDRIFADFDELYEDMSKYKLARTYLIEFYYYGPEILRYSQRFDDFVSNFDTLMSNGRMEEELENLRSSIEGFYKNYDAKTDLRTMQAQLPIFLENAPSELNSYTLSEYVNGKSSEEASERIYEASVFDEEQTLVQLLDEKPKKIYKVLSNDPVYLIASEILGSYRTNVSPGYAAFSQIQDELMSKYIAAKLNFYPDAMYSPDANSTLRLTFGKMEGSEPRDGVSYTSYTTIDGIIEKYIPGDKEFDLPSKLIDLYETKDYGPYGVDGELRVCFLGSNHTTGGNSGSPTLNAKGELVGLNFDRTWESTMSDIMFNGEICRNIMVDVNYILFIIDRFAGAKHLVDEMNLVRNSEPNVESSSQLIEQN